MHAPAFALALLYTGVTFAQPVPQVALQGNDPVTYFTERRPSKGAAKIQYDFQESRYLFSSTANRDLFVTTPERYAPQFGGFSGPELVTGTRAAADPNVFLVRSGRLYLFSSPKARELAIKDPDVLRRAHAVWEKK